jgi:hypothetical protein
VPFVRSRKISEVLTVSTLVARNANEAMVAYGRVCICLESGRRFVSAHLAGIWLQSPQKMFSHLTTLQRDVTHVALCTRLAKTVPQHAVVPFDTQKGPIPSTLTGHTRLLI